MAFPLSTATPSSLGFDVRALERLQERHGDEIVHQPRPALLSSPLPTRRFA